MTDIGEATIDSESGLGTWAIMLLSHIVEVFDQLY